VTPIDGRSLWSDTLPDGERSAGSPLAGDADVDVAIVGAGLTGLWTAWYLLQRDPDLRVAVLERETVGFGASGRNGGWCSALLPMSLPSLARRHGDAAARRMQSAMHHTVEEVGRFARDHADPDVYRRGGTLELARSRPQADRLRDDVELHRRFGFGDDDYRWLDAAEASEMCSATDVVGAVYTPHCATVHPLRLTHAVARAVLAAGGAVHDHTEVLELASGRVTTVRGTVRAAVCVRATEGYTCRLPGERRSLLPIYSLMIATEPLPDETWAEIGLHDRPTFSDGRHMLVYGQRTADGRIAFGGRGAPYHFGSAIEPAFDTDPGIRDLLSSGLRELLPQIGDAAVTHHWGGVLAAPRDWTCGVRFDRASGMASAGGYVGDGVATTNLAGRTLAGLITGVDDELLRLPWVGHRSRPWEPEPVRWLGVNGARLAARRADLFEERTGRRSRLWGGLVGRLLGD
jgi:glycine/D-amino acid oxidase-like deaminating enzyme